jgi:hypothetical protein
MALTPAEKQRRYRERSKALAQSSLEAVERGLLQQVERAERGELSAVERTVLADELADAAKDHLWRAHHLSKLAMRVRTSG